MFHAKDADVINELVEKIKNDDQSAFKEFYEIYHRSVFYFLHRYAFDYDVVCDLTQETFIKFWQKRKNLEICSYPQAYLFKIARNLALNSIRNRSHFAYFEEDENFLIALAKNPVNEYDKQFVLSDFQKALKKLPEKCCTVFVLSRYQEFSYEEIAKTLDISLQTVKNQMNKALAILRKALAKHID